MFRQICLIVVVFLAAFNVQAQQIKSPRSNQNVSKIEKTSATSNQAVKSSAAYSELLAAQVEAKVDLKVLLFDYNEAASEVIAKKGLIELFQIQINKLQAMPASVAPKLTLALGRLLVKKVEAEANLKSLSEEYADQHPSVKKARVRLEVFTEESDKLLQ